MFNFKKGQIVKLTSEKYACYLAKDKPMIVDHITDRSVYFKDPINGSGTSVEHFLFKFMTFESVSA